MTPKAQQIEQLTALVSEVNSCTKCDLHTTRKRAVPGMGPVPCHIMIIGEAPGAEEDALGLPFVGSSGQLLQKLLARAGLNRNMVYIANTVKCRPPNNRDPYDTEKAACSPYLARQIELVNPTIIVTLGRVSMEMFVVGSPITQAHGKLYSVILPQQLSTPTNQRTDYTVYPVYHPAYAMRQTQRLEELVADFNAIPDLLLHKLKGTEDAR